MKKLIFGFLFLALGAMILHEVHPDACHLSVNDTDGCCLCRTVRSADVPMIAVTTPRLNFETVRRLDSDFVVVKNISCLSDPRGPPLS